MRDKIIRNLGKIPVILATDVSVQVQLELEVSASHLVLRP